MTDGEEAPELGELRAELARRFGEELDERIPRMERSLERLLAPDGDDPRSTRETLAALGLDAHSIKGGAQLVGRPEVGRLAEALEGHFDRLSAAGGDGTVHGSPGTPDQAALGAARAVLAVLRLLAAGTRVPPSRIDEAIRTLEPLESA